MGPAAPPASVTVPHRATVHAPGGSVETVRTAWLGPPRRPSSNARRRATAHARSAIAHSAWLGSHLHPTATAHARAVVARVSPHAALRDLQQRPSCLQRTQGSLAACWRSSRAAAARGPTSDSHAPRLSWRDLPGASAIRPPGERVVVRVRRTRSRLARSSRHRTAVTAPACVDRPRRDDLEVDIHTVARRRPTACRIVAGRHNQSHSPGPRDDLTRMNIHAVHPRCRPTLTMRAIRTHLSCRI